MKNSDRIIEELNLWLEINFEHTLTLEDRVVLYFPNFYDEDEIVKRIFEGMQETDDLINFGNYYCYKFEKGKAHCDSGNTGITHGTYLHIIERDEMWNLPQEKYDNCIVL